MLVEDLNNSCMRQAHQTVLVSPAYKYMQSMLDKMCHIEVWRGEGGQEMPRNASLCCSTRMLLQLQVNNLHRLLRQVIEYCDLGNLSTALKNQVFVVSSGDKVLQQLAEAAANGRSDVGSSELRAKAGQVGGLSP